MCLHYPKTITPPWSVEKLSSTKPVPGAKKVEDRCSTLYYFIFLMVQNLLIPVL